MPNNIEQIKQRIDQLMILRRQQVRKAEEAVQTLDQVRIRIEDIDLKLQQLRTELRS